MSFSPVPLSVNRNQRMAKPDSAAESLAPTRFLRAKAWYIRTNPEGASIGGRQGSSTKTSARWPLTPAFTASSYS